MKPLVRYILSGVTLAAFAALWFLADRAAAGSRRAVTCQGVKAVVADSTERRFVVEEDIVAWMADYGTYVGLRLDSVDLRRIETIMDGKSAVLKSQAWLTDDGYIHISVTQREPVVRFQKGNVGFYADRNGFLFPLQSRHTSRVPVVDGAVPVNVDKGFKGEPGTKEEAAWIRSIVGLMRYMQDSKVWADNISQITVLPGGDLMLIPREGSERFLFGRAAGIAAKFGRIRRYYDTIAPEAEGYTTVDVRYDGQIVCRKK
ncbi:MAG: hypothetical protein IJ721_06205 [Bacteroidales bacterium]|nr:hypothetical protein [Bacteroidales bacterium]